jgi:hypothetical protein
MENWELLAHEHSEGRVIVDVPGSGDLLHISSSGDTASDGLLLTNGSGGLPHPLIRIHENF